MPRTRSGDRGANYNAFGYDPNGFIAWIAAFFYGKWVPSCPAQIFGGPPEPPRYGPPAEYQLSSLPEGFVPNAPPSYHGYNPTLVDADTEDFLDPPESWDPHVFATLRDTSSFSFDTDKGESSTLGW